MIMAEGFSLLEDTYLDTHLLSSAYSFWQTLVALGLFFCLVFKIHFHVFSFLSFMY